MCYPGDSWRQIRLAEIRREYLEARQPYMDMLLGIYQNTSGQTVVVSGDRIISAEPLLTENQKEMIAEIESELDKIDAIYKAKIV